MQLEEHGPMYMPLGQEGKKKATEYTCLFRDLASGEIGAPVDLSEIQC